MNKLKSNIFIKLFFISFIALGSFNFVITMDLINQEEQAEEIDECPICYENSRNVELPCGHWHCYNCIRTYFEPAVNGQSLATLKCIEPGCDVEINNYILRELGYTEQQIQNIANLRRPVQVDTSEPSIRQNTKPCPRCHAPIEKNEGCLHMTCTRCTHEFYWCCLRPWPIAGHGGNNVFYGVCDQEITNEEAHNRYNGHRNVQPANNIVNRPNQARPVNQPNIPAQQEFERNLANIFGQHRNIQAQANNLNLQQQPPRPPHNNKKPIAILAAMAAIGGYVWYKSKKNRTTTPKNTKDQIEKVNLAKHVTKQNQKAKLTKKETQKTYLGKAYSAVSSTSLKVIKFPITIKNALVKKLYKK